MAHPDDSHSPKAIAALLCRNGIGRPRLTGLDALRVRATPIRRLYQLIRTERKHSPSIPLRQKIAAWRRGYSAQMIEVLGYERVINRRVMPDSLHINHYLRCAHYNTIRNKLNFAATLDVLNVRYPFLFGYINQGKAYDPRGIAPPATDLHTWLDGLLEEHGQLVFKPAVGGGGVGLMFLRREDGKDNLNGKPVDLETFSRVMGRIDDYLCMEHLTQAAYSRALYPRTTNTVRVMTMWDGDTHEPFLAAAVHRIGSARSYPVDNFHKGSGGISAPIDMETGVIGTGLRLKDRQRTYEDCHFETGAAIAGVVIPGWPDVVRMLLNAARNLPHGSFIGWDLVVAEDGPICIEANFPPGVQVWEVHENQVIDPRSARFYKQYFEAEGLRLHGGFYEPRGGAK